MNYPAIKDRDKVSFEYERENNDGSYEDIVVNTTVRIIANSQIIFGDSPGSGLSGGYQDNPQLMENGITNFRIHERADGTPVFMEGDEVSVDDKEYFIVWYVLGDLAFIGEVDLEHPADDFISPLSFEHMHSTGWKLKDQEKEEKKSNEALRRLNLMKERGCGFLCSPTVCSSTCDNYPKEWGLKDQGDTVEEESGINLWGCPKEGDCTCRWCSWRLSEMRDKMIKSAEYILGEDEKTYTKQEIVDVLKEANIQISHNSTNLLEKMMMFSGVNIVTEKLDITSEELE